jgi:hypothetical protein
MKNYECMLKVKVREQNDMGLLLVKNHLLMQFVESIWIKHLYLHLCSKLVFPFRK